MSWRVARSLDVLLEEINAAAPRRSKVSDGSIGDADHGTRDSDHNPFVVLDGEGIVRARDFTHSPAGGLDCDVLAAHLVDLARAGTHPALGPGAYVIWEGRIASSTEDGQPWDWEPYFGSNPHRHHLHLSVALAPSRFDSTRPWGVITQEDIVNQDDIDKIADAAVKKLLATKIEVKRGGSEPVRRLSIEQVLRETFQRA